MSAGQGQPLDLEAIRARAEAATDGPWHWEAGMRGYPQTISNPQAIIVANTYINPDYPATDADFIAAARSDVPALLAEVERQRPIVDAAYAWRRTLAGIGKGAPVEAVMAASDAAAVLIAAVDKLTKGTLS